MSQENVEVLKAAYDAFLRGDEPALVELIADDFVVKNPRGLLDVAPVRHGHQGWKEFLGEFQDVFEGFAVDIKEWVDAGDWVLCVSHWTGRAKASGVKVEANQVDAARVLDGKIVEMNLSHRSKEAALKAVGLSEQDAHADS